MLAGRVALVTGGGSGIGRSVCKIFAREGAKVIAADINEKAAAETITSIGSARNEHNAVKLDVISEKSVLDTLSVIKEKYSQGPNVVVNCAGITSDNFLDKMTEEEFDRVLKINLKGTFLMVKAASTLMIETSITNGSIINISSIVGKVGNMGQSNYAASKAGVEGLTKTAAKELAKYNIRCNAILPGFIDTPMVATVPDKVIQKLKAIIPLGRMGKPDEVADVCLFLASDESSFVTGSQIEVTGGIFM